MTQDPARGAICSCNAPFSSDGKGKGGASPSGGHVRPLKIAREWNRSHSEQRGQESQGIMQGKEDKATMHSFSALLAPASSLDSSRLVEVALANVESEARLSRETQSLLDDTVPTPPPLRQAKRSMCVCTTTLVQRRRSAQGLGDSVPQRVPCLDPCLCP